eukprot:GILJ01004961.1.p1 GENE.GILJ01004961.1~~GILJ01004961.1.p1  ORF type:complete len:286 (-),score=10.92 GILJ01004961.1:168-983(-)
MASLRSVNATAPYWGHATSNIDWCEENYVVCHSFAQPFWWCLLGIAEFFNTLSNFWGIILGLWGLRQSLKDKAEFRISLCYFACTFVFCGSLTFHATLLYHFQLLDEMPMIYGTLFCHYMIYNDRRSPMFSGIVISVVGILIFIVMYLTRESPLPLQIAYGFLVCTLIIRSVSRYQLTRYKAAKRYMWYALYTYGAGFACWLMDRHACDYVSPFYFHAWWHVLTATGCYFWMQSATFFRAEAQGNTAEVVMHFWGMWPYVRIKRTQRKKTK